MKKLIIILFLFSSKIFSEDTKLETPKEESDFLINLNQDQTVENPISTVNIVQLLITLVLVFFSMYGIFFFIKKSNSKGLKEGDLIKLIDSKNIGSNRFLHLIRLGSRVYFISSTDTNINLLSEISDKDELSRINLDSSVQNAVYNDESFLNMLKNKENEDLNVNKIKENKLNLSSFFLKDQKDKLKKMNLDK